MGAVRSGTVYIEVDQGRVGWAETLGASIDETVAEMAATKSLRSVSVAPLTSTTRAAGSIGLEHAVQTVGVLVTVLWEER